MKEILLGKFKLGTISASIIYYSGEKNTQSCTWMFAKSIVLLRTSLLGVIPECFLFFGLALFHDISPS